jgi:mRNA interferase MazF
MDLSLELEKFIKWSKLKIRIHVSEHPEFYFHEREIWWASLGANIGFEQDGKHDKFERPILILKKFGGRTLWALPITSKEKNGRFYYQFEYNSQKYSVILSQLRLISSKRLLRKIRTISNEDFFKIIKLIKDFI